MIVIRYREDPTATLVMAAAIVLLAGSVAFMFLAPRPNADLARKNQTQRKVAARIATQIAEQDLAGANAYVATNTWSGSIEDVTPQALGAVTRGVKQRGLILLSFRPQRAAATVQPVQLPFMATVEGTYPSILQFARDLETKGTKLVVNSIMVSSSDADSDRVTASIGLVAFINPAATKPAPIQEKPSA